MSLNATTVGYPTETIEMLVIMCDLVSTNTRYDEILCKKIVNGRQTEGMVC